VRKIFYISRSLAGRLSPVPLFSTYPTELVNWKDCKVSEDEEKEMAAAFRKKF